MTNIRVNTANLLQEKFQIDPGITALLFESGALQEHHCRDLLIKDEYKKKAQPKERQRLRGKLADKYCISVSLVEKIVSLG